MLFIAYILLGIPALAFLAAALDPRTKKLRGIPEEEKEMIWNAVSVAAIALHQPSSSAAPTVTRQDVDTHPAKRPNVVTSFFLDEDCSGNEAENEDDFIRAISNEIHQYRNMKNLRHRDAATNKPNCPLLWWKAQIRSVK